MHCFLSLGGLLHVRSTGTCRDHSVTLHLYRRALAGAIARGLSLQRRSRLHFVRGSRVEAATSRVHVAEDAKNHYENEWWMHALHVMVTVSRHVIRVENTVTTGTSNLEALEVDLNDTTSNYFLLSLLVLTCSLHLPSSEYVSMIKRLRRKLLYM